MYPSPFKSVFPRHTIFFGQAFRFVTAVQPLMYMPDDWEVLMPIEAWEFSESTPTVSAKGLIQGGTLNHGSGKVAVFGEAAMFTEQLDSKQTPFP